MKIVEILSVNQQIEHVVSLATDLQTGFDPVDRRRLEELRRFERAEEITFLLRFRRPVFQRIQNVILE